MAEHRYPERTVASPRDPITVGLRVPHELTGGAAGLRDYAAKAEAAGIDLPGCRPGQAERDDGRFLPASVRKI